MILHTKYSGSMHCSLREEDVFPLLVYTKHVTPGATQFWPQGHNLNKLGRYLLGDVTYQLSRL